MPGAVAHRTWRSARRNRPSVGRQASRGLRCSPPARSTKPSSDEDEHGFDVEVGRQPGDEDDAGNRGGSHQCGAGQDLPAAAVGHVGTPTCGTRTGTGTGGSRRGQAAARVPSCAAMSVSRHREPGPARRRSRHRVVRHARGEAVRVRQASPAGSSEAAGRRPMRHARCPPPRRAPRPDSAPGRQRACAPAREAGRWHLASWRVAVPRPRA